MAADSGASNSATTISSSRSAQYAAAPNPIAAAANQKTCSNTAPNPNARADKSRWFDPLNFPPRFPTAAPMQNQNATDGFQVVDSRPFRQFTSHASVPPPGPSCANFHSEFSRSPFRSRENA